MPPFLSPAPPAAATSRPVKVLLVGDSMAGSLGVGLSQFAHTFHLQIANEGIPGCSLSMQQQIKVLWYTVAPDPPCDVNNNPNSLLDQWRTWVDNYNPDVVLYLGRGETFSQEVGGVWGSPGQPSFDGYLQSRFRQAVDVLGGAGCCRRPADDALLRQRLGAVGVRLAGERPGPVAARQRGHAGGGRRGGRRDDQRGRQGQRLRPRGAGLAGARVRGFHRRGQRALQ
jgi:hypothetical protein